MKIKFRVSTEELIRLCSEMQSFLGTLKNTRKFHRFEICNQVKENGSFTFDLNVVDGFDHKTNSWRPGVVTEIELGTKKECCFNCSQKYQNITPAKTREE